MYLGVVCRVTFGVALPGHPLWSSALAFASGASCATQVSLPQGKLMGRGKVNIRFKLKARVSSSNPPAIEAVLEGLVTKGSVMMKAGDEFLVEPEMKGESAKDLNRSLLSALRRVEKRTRLRAEWTAQDNTTERFFDYVLKKTIKN